MPSIVFGRIALPSWIIPAAVAGLGGVLCLLVVARREKDLRKRTMDIVVGAILAYLAVWKLSPAVLSAGLVLRNPLMLVYSPGGTWGTVLGVLGAALYVLIRIVRSGGEAKSRVLVLIAVFAVTAMAGGGLAVGIGRIIASDGTSASEISSAPAFQLVDTQGKQHRLEDYLGSTVVLNFWASWCPPCRAEIPELSRYYDTLEGQAVFLSINQTASDLSAVALGRFATEHKIDYPILLDTRNEVFLRYGIRGIPTTIIIDALGRVRARRSGAVDRSWLIRQVNRASEGLPEPRL